MEKPKFRPEAESQDLDRKMAVVGRFKEEIEDLIAPSSYLLFGSVGRGACKENSDIDSMVIFDDEDAEEFVANDFLGRLPFDSNTNGLITDRDKDDLRNQKIDFLRIKAKSGDENVELQLFPLSSIRKAAGIFSSEIIAGTKRADGKYELSDLVQSRPTLNFRGDRVYFEKSPKLAAGRDRIDISEVGSKKDDPAWIRGLTLGKLIAPKIVSDRLEIAKYLDDHVLRGVIRALLYNLNLYVTDNTGKIIGVKKQVLDYHVLFNILHSHKAEDGIVENYQFGKDEEQNLKYRYDRQVADIVARNNYEVFNEE